MKINPLLLGSAVIYGVAGVALLFAPAEMVALAGGEASAAGEWMGQLLGGAILGLAWLNWLQRYAVTGGILGRPVLLANLMFTTVAFFGSLHAWRATGGAAPAGVALVAGILWIGYTVRLVGRAGARSET